jgi:hypothetical protein
VRGSLDVELELRSVRGRVQRRQGVHRWKVQVSLRRDGLQRPLRRFRHRPQSLRELHDEMRAPNHVQERHVQADVTN